MRVPTFLPALACTLMLSAQGGAAPVRIEPLAFVLPVEPTATLDQDLGRQGYVTAFRSPVMTGLVQGRGAPRQDRFASAVSALDASIAVWTVTTATTTSAVFRPILGGLPQFRPEASQQPSPAISSILSLRELGQLDGGTGAMRRVIDGQRTGGELDLFALRAWHRR